MQLFDLKGTLREGLGKKATKALRKAESVPCVLYGGKENVHFQVTSADIRKLIYTPHVYVVNLTIDGKVTTKAVMREIQFHPVKDTVLHIDFYEVHDDKAVEVEVPVRLEGLAEGVRAGGKLSQAVRKLRVKGLWNDIPDVLTINVENLSIGKVIQVKDLAFDKVHLLNSPSVVVAAVKATRASASQDTAEESAAAPAPAAAAE